MTTDQQFTLLEEVLSSIAGGKNTTTDSIKEATNALNSQFLTQPTSIPLFVKVLSTSPHWQIRQLAAVELKKLITKFWRDTAPNTCEDVRSVLPNLLVQEPEKLPRLSIAQVIGAIALIDLPENKWPSLIEIVSQCCTSSNSGQREVGVHLLEVLFDVIYEHFPAQLDGVFNIISSTLADPESQLVRVESVLVLAKFADSLESSQKELVSKFQSAVPVVVKVLQQAIADSDVSAANKIMEMFEAALLSDASLLNPCFQELSVFMLNSAADKSAEPEIRSTILTFLYWAAQHKKTRITKLGLLDSYLRCAMTVSTEPEDLDDDTCPTSTAVVVVSSIATHFPAHQVFSTLGPLILEFVNHPEAEYRKAAMLALAVASEGCAEYLSTKMSEILPLVSNSLQDPSNIVRRAACFALYNLTDDNGEEVCKYHESILPHLFTLLADNDPEVAKNVWNAIDSFMSELGDKTQLYLPALMERSGEYLNNLPVSLQSTAITAIGSAAGTSGKAFIPYFQTFITQLRNFLTIQSEDPELVTLRAVATDAVASIASSVGKDIIAPYVQELMTLAFEGMKIKGPYIRSSGLALFANIAALLESDFVNFLEPVMEQIKFTLDQCEFGTQEGEDASDNGSGDDVDDVNIRSDISDEKEVAMSSTIDIFRAVGGAFIPYLEELTQEYISMLDHYSDSMRGTAFETLLKFAEILAETLKVSEWEAGLPLKNPIDSGLATLINLIMPVIMEKWNEETDPSVVNMLLITLDQSISIVGPALIQNHVEEITKNIELILKKQALCQIIDDDEERDENEDLAEVEAQLIVNAADVLGSMTKAIGPDFMPLFEPFFNLLKKHFKSSASESERSMVVAVFGDIMLGLGSIMTVYTNELIEIYQQGLVDTAPIVRSNAAFGTGILCATTTADISSVYPDLFSRLSPLFQNQPHNITDNACGAVCRMIKACPTACPINEIIPAVINNLPLREDFAENEPVYECLINLIQSNHESVAPHMDRLRELFTQMINNTPDQLPEPLLNALRGLLA